MDIWESGTERNAQEGGQSRTSGGPGTVGPRPDRLRSRPVQTLIRVNAPALRHASPVPVFCLRCVWPTSFR